MAGGREQKSCNLVKISKTVGRFYDCVVLAVYGVPIKIAASASVWGPSPTAGRVDRTANNTLIRNKI